MLEEENLSQFKQNQLPLLHIKKKLTTAKPIGKRLGKKIYKYITQNKTFDHENQQHIHINRASERSRTLKKKSDQGNETASEKEEFEEIEDSRGST